MLRKPTRVWRPNSPTIVAKNVTSQLLFLRKEMKPCQTVPNRKHVRCYITVLKKIEKVSVLQKSSKIT